MPVQTPNQESRALDVEELLERCMGNIELADRVLTKLQTQCGEDVVELERALFEKDGHRLATIAHRLKGAASNVAAHGLQRCAARIEDAARKNLLDAIPIQLEALRNQWSRLNETSLSQSVPCRCVR